ncbi:hypothetical protein SCACP_02050 [Sporomusa carbonis]|uniref:hypothetical protein n=1 Tax=Sporomusa carbonis TaxID=3076075 RepID=UPI003A654F98
MLAEKYDVFLLDLDGVIYVGNEILPGSSEAVSRLRKMGKQVYFLTNDPRPGIHAKPDECITAGWATANYLTQNSITCVHAVGTEGLKVLISWGLRQL